MIENTIPRKIMGYQLQRIRSRGRPRKMARTNLRSGNRPWGLMLVAEEEAFSSFLHIRFLYDSNFRYLVAILYCTGKNYNK
jgi:hypothetical protein